MIGRASTIAFFVALAISIPRPGAGETDRGILFLEQSRGGDVLRQLEIEQGKSMLVNTAYNVKRVSVGNPDIADVVVLGPRELHFVAKQVGETNVVLWDAKGRAQAAIDLAISRPHGGIEAQMRRMLQSDDIVVEGAGDSIVLRGTVSSTDDVERALRLARGFFPGRTGPDDIINLLGVGGNHQVMIEVTIAEMSRQFTREMESNFAIIDQGDFRVFSFLGNITSLGGADLDSQTLLLSDRVNLVADLIDVGGVDYSAFLNLLQGQGLVKILAEPNLVARSGQSASFLVGGEIPIPVAQGGAFGSITIEFKDFGVGVEFTPTVFGPDRIHLEVTPEVSEPDFTIGTSVEGTVVPGFNTRRASTAVDLGDGQAFAIAGLLRDDVRELTSHYPLLGDLPVLGALFRSKQYQRNETELVLLVRPRLVKPLPPGPYRLPGDDFIEPSGWEFYLTNALEGSGPSAGPSRSEARPPGFLGDVGHRVSIAEAEKELK